MGVKAVQLAQEQAYFDAAAKHRDRKLTTLEDVARAGAHASAAAHLRRYAKLAAAAIGDGDTAVAFGRIDDEHGERLYIGRHLIRDDDHQVLVVNWQAPAAAPYYEASPADPQGLVRKRTFECEGNRIRDFTDVRYAEVTEAIDQLLLRELSRDRTGAMRDIVATIQAAQYDIIRAPIDRVLVIEGGPGTGKTAVALHRISWLLFRYRDHLQPSDVLVVGPHPTFMRYISEVLPSLGDTEVELRDISQLAPSVSHGRSEPVEVSRLKGEARMAGLLSRALDARVGEPEPAERLLLHGRFVTLPGPEVAELVATCRVAGLPYADRRQLLRARLVQLLRDRTGSDPTGQDALTNLLDRLWPPQSAPAFLRDLFGSRRRLRAAAGDEFTEDELALLYRRGADRLSEEEWSAADLPLLDEAEHLINGGERRYAHVLVDEAQDLSPMQLRSIARRSATGSLTIVGDLAQSTGPWARDNWQDVTSQLPATYPVALAPLRYGYRVPRQVYELAAQLLPVAAPHVQPPAVVRDGPAEPQIHRVGLADRAGRVAAVAAGHAEQGQFVGVVCPPRCRREVEAALAAAGVGWSSADRGELGSAVNLVSPQEVKGLEFDALVVVEPEQIVAGDERGHRLLYVALTRTTRYLDIVCVGEPLPLTVPPQDSEPEQPAGAASFGARDVERLAEHLAAQLRNAAPVSAWQDVLNQLARRLAEEYDGRGAP
ncbi:MAG TPA: UvrD-helicase domain-containing protein [Natronosporangium sp.]